ncbi:MAG TPA: hypothetical protein VFQ37_13690, partial [Mycobacterium sp.]|nr:hypothetical protein [Mycobacterium sp.]
KSAPKLSSHGGSESAAGATTAEATDDGSKMSDKKSNSSACADGALTNGVTPNAKNAPAALAVPIARLHRRAFVLCDR